MPKHKISICIACMNRMHQLKQTLRQNIIDNEDYQSLEFVLLDYNSTDGLQEWIYDNFSSYLQNKKLVYYHTTEPQEFNHSQAKNTMFRLAQGDIVCNINADHFTGPGYAAYVDSLFEAEPNIVLTTVDYFRVNKNYRPPKDVFGKLCVKKDDFLKLGGFDETMLHYGFEDWDIVNRLEMYGLNRRFIDDPKFLQFVSHDSSERYSFDGLYQNLKGIFISYLTPSASELILLNQDGSFKKGVLMDNTSHNAEKLSYAYRNRKYTFLNSLKKNDWIKGNWTVNDAEGSLVMTYPNKNKRHVEFEAAKRQLRDKNKIYYQLTDTGSINSIMEFAYFFENRAIMEKNLSSKNIRVNPLGFKKINVYNNTTLVL